MGIKARIFVECDLCGATSSDVSTVVKNAVKLPDGWTHNTSLGIMCESCKKRLDNERDDFTKLYNVDESIPPLLSLAKNYYDNKNVRSLKYERDID